MQQKKIKQPPHQKCYFAVGSLLLLQCIGILVVIYRTAWCIFRPQCPKIKVLCFSKKEILKFGQIELFRMAAYQAIKEIPEILG